MFVITLHIRAHRHIPTFPQPDSEGSSTSLHAAARCDVTAETNRDISLGITLMTSVWH